MAERTTGLRAALSSPRLYFGFQRLLGARAAQERIVSDFLKPRPGDRILDIGCGPARILSSLPEVSYLGIDISERYIEAARREYGDRAEFRCQDIREADVPEREFDAVLVLGLLHHLEDGEADRLLEAAAGALRDSGRLLGIENVYVEGQSRIARWLIDRDRGMNVRSQGGYEALAIRHFADVRSTVIKDFFRIPYTHLVLECREPRAA